RGGGGAHRGREREARPGRAGRGRAGLRVSPGEVRMSTRRAFALAAVALSGGCALASCYDFGKSTETGGAGGAGGRAAGATVSSGVGGGSSASSSGRPASVTTGSTG